MLKFATVFTSVALVACIPDVCGAQTVYAVLTGDTVEGPVGVDVSLSKMQALLKQLEREGAVKVVVNTSVQGGAFGCDAIRKAVAQTPWTKDDTVLFYYAGHGYKDNPDQLFPGLDCRTSVTDQRTDLNAIVKIISHPGAASYPPRLLIAIADACNEGPEFVLAAAAGQPAAGIKRKEAFRKLFLGYKGTIIMAGSKPGEYSYYALSQGGFFTSTRLLPAIDNAINAGNDATWSAINDAATKPIKLPENGQGQKLQDPISNVSLESVSYQQ